MQYPSGNSFDKITSYPQSGAVPISRSQKTFQLTRKLLSFFHL
ncbi:hypothetical protein NSP_29620 [Nodularia spumigena CCY9414]|nr:hypothetical protein NSP_29620 [Nodularia spumigena CCY9414]